MVLVPGFRGMNAEDSAWPWVWWDMVTVPVTLSAVAVAAAPGNRAPVLQPLGNKSWVRWASSEPTGPENGDNPEQEGMGWERPASGYSGGVAQHPVSLTSGSL